MRWRSNESKHSPFPKFLFLRDVFVAVVASKASLTLVFKLSYSLFISFQEKITGKSVAQIWPCSFSLRCYLHFKYHSCQVVANQIRPKERLLLVCNLAARAENFSRQNSQHLLQILEAAFYRMSRLQVLDYFLLDSIFTIILKCAFFFRSTVTYQPDAYCFNTCSLRSRSNRPHSILSAVRGDQNFYNKRLHDWCSCDTRETHSSRGRQNYALVSSFNHIPSLKYF